MTTTKPLTPSQAKTLTRLRELLAAGPVDVTYRGIKGINSSSLWTLEGQGAITVERYEVEGRSHPNMFVTAINT